MSITVDFINNQNALLQSEISSNSDDATAFHNTLICLQHESTSRQLRQLLLSHPPSQRNVLRELQNALRQYSNTIDKLKLPNVIRLERTEELELKRNHRRLSVDLHSIEGIEEDIEAIEEQEQQLRDNENLTQLRKRLLDGRSKSSSSRSLDKGKEQSFDEELQSEEQIQEGILENMSGFLQGIKEGANEFQKRLSQDQHYLEAAEKGLEVTSKKLKKTSINLSKTIDTLTWKDLLWLCAIGIGLFLVSMLLIAVIPKF